MKKIINGFIALLLGGCVNIANPPKSETNQNITGLLCVPDFIDGKQLDPPTTLLDEITKIAIAALNDTKSTTPKLAIGVLNRHHEIKRFKQECGDWTLLDSDGVENGPAFLHVDLSDQKALEALSKELLEQFNRIDFDYSVTRLANDFSYDSLFLFLAMLKKDGTLNAWLDEWPFQASTRSVNKAQFRYEEQLVSTRLGILNKILGMAQIPDSALTQIWLNDGFKFSFEPDIDPQDVARLSALVAEHEQKKREVLKKIFASRGFEMKVKSGGFPLPKGGFDYTSLEYVEITRLK